MGSDWRSARGNWVGEDISILFACTGRAQDGRRPPRLSTSAIYSFLLCAAQRSGLYRKMPNMALIPFDNVEKQKQRFSRGVAKTLSSFGRSQHERLAFLREELHLDVQRVLERLFRALFVDVFGRVSSSLWGL